MWNPGKLPKERKEGNGDLHAAARSGNLRAVKAICSSNLLAVNSRDKHSRTPLHLAAWSGQTEVVRYLCKHKADVGAVDMDDVAAIHYASQKGRLEVVRILLSLGASVEDTNKKGLTPLHYAAQQSYIDLVKYLVGKGANISAKTKAGQTPSHFAQDNEVCFYLEKCERVVRMQRMKLIQELTTTRKTDEPIKDQSYKEENVVSDPKNADNEADPGDEELSAKRKGEESAEQGLSRLKKAKVSLGHLAAKDDTQEKQD